MDDPTTTDLDRQRLPTPASLVTGVQTGDDRLDITLESDAADVLAAASEARASWDRDHAPIGYAPEDLDAVADAARADVPTSLTFFEAHRAADALHWYAGELTRRDHDEEHLTTVLDLASALRRLVQAAENLA